MAVATKKPRFSPNTQGRHDITNVQLILASADYLTLARAISSGKGVPVRLWTACGRAVLAGDSLRDEGLVLKTLLARGWLLQPTSGNSQEVDLELAEWATDDDWWERVDMLGHVASTCGWCLVPWGANSEAIGVVAAVFGSRAAGGKSWSASGRLLKGLPGSPKAIWDYPLHEGQPVNFRAAILTERFPGWLLADAFFPLGMRPLVSFLSPEGFEFLTDNSVANPRWLEDGYEILGSIDGTGRQDVPWFYRPRNTEAFIEMCRLIGQPITLVAAIGNPEPSWIAEMHRLEETVGAYAVVERLAEIHDRVEILYITPFVALDLYACLIAGWKARDLLSDVADKESQVCKTITPL